MKTGLEVKKLPPPEAKTCHQAADQALAAGSRVRVYATIFGHEEEIRFPLASEKHSLHCETGRLEYYVQNTNARGYLEPGEALLVLRKDKKEYLDLRAQAVGGTATAVWITQTA